MSKPDLDQNHAAMVAALIKPGEDIIAETTPLKAHLNHMAMLLAGEAGEVVDAIKKHTIYGKDLDFVNVIEELGDIEFALEAIRESLGIHRDETLAMNMEKLSKRYPQGAFSNADAQTRADKSPVQEALELAESDAVETGTGYIEVNVTEDQSVEVSHVEPSLVSGSVSDRSDDSGIIYPPNTTENVFLQYHDGKKWTCAGGPFNNEHIAWISLGGDNHGYRTVMGGKVLTDKS